MVHLARSWVLTKRSTQEVHTAKIEDCLAKFEKQKEKFQSLLEQNASLGEQAKVATDEKLSLTAKRDALQTTSSLVSVRPLNSELDTPSRYSSFPKKDDIAAITKAFPWPKDTPLDEYVSSSMGKLEAQLA